jgi:hypothetical protein
MGTIIPNTFRISNTPPVPHLPHIYRSIPFNSPPLEQGPNPPSSPTDRILPTYSAHVLPIQRHRQDHDRYRFLAGCTYLSQYYMGGVVNVLQVCATLQDFTGQARCEELAIRQSGITYIGHCLGILPLGNDLSMPILFETYHQFPIGVYTKELLQHITGKSESLVLPG